MGGSGGGVAGATNALNTGGGADAAGAPTGAAGATSGGGGGASQSLSVESTVTVALDFSWRKRPRFMAGGPSGAPTAAGPVEALAASTATVFFSIKEDTTRCSYPRRLANRLNGRVVAGDCES